MRVTIEIEPEEAARFVKAFMPEQLQGIVLNKQDYDWAKTDWSDFFTPRSDQVYGPGLMPFWNEAASKWLDAIRDSNGNETK